jgi:MFS family permease
MRLLRESTFRHLWAASTISNFGTMFGALSLTAIIYLDASPAELGWLTAAASVPVLLFATAAGVWIDRLPRVPIMIAADVGRFVALATVPAAALGGALMIEQLYAVAFVVGALNVTFELAFRSVLPALVPRDDIIDANSALGISDSVSGSVAPAIGGGVAQTAGGPVAVLVDALTFVTSAVFISRVREPASPASARRRPAVTEAAEGLRTVTRHRRLRAIFAMVVTYSFFSGFILTLYGLWVIDGLGLSPLALGILLGSGGLGSLAGASFAGRASRRLGLGRSIVVTYVVAAALSFLTPLAAGPAWLAFAMLLTEQCVGDTFWTAHNIQALTLRQTIVPGDQLGRVNATFLLASQGLRPLGAVVAGAVAGIVGLQAGLLISCVGINVAGLWLLFSPLVSRAEDADTTPVAVSR